MGTSQTICLLSGPVIPDPLNRMLRFCHEEYAYYDGLPTSDPNRVEPMDVLAAVAINGFYNANTATLRTVHRGLSSTCDAALTAIPVDADLLAADTSLESST